jgi:hypothetical protein
VITAETRACGLCRAPLAGDDVACGKCGRMPCPRVETWPDGAKRFLFLLLLTDALATKLKGFTEQQQLEYLLENVMRGRYYGGEVLSRSANAANCYPYFVKLLEEWKSRGSPNDANAIAQLRGAS